MSGDQIMAEFRALAPAERERVARLILHEDESWIPESFSKGMREIEEGRTVDLDAALTEPARPE